jgi:uncharacterized protein
MTELWLRIDDIPADGRVFSFSDQSIWTDRWEEFKLPYAPGRPIEAELTILPQKDGCLIRGRIAGAVKQPCDRCAEEVEVQIDESFEVYEDIRDGESGPDAETWLRRKDKVLELDVAGLLWEQFLLVMPDHPLCAPDCRGICPGCGQDLNTGTCTCDGGEGDPRMAALRNLKLS